MVASHPLHVCAGLQEQCSAQHRAQYQRHAVVLCPSAAAVVEASLTTADHLQAAHRCSHNAAHLVQVHTLRMIRVIARCAASIHDINTETCTPRQFAGAEHSVTSRQRLLLCGAIRAACKGVQAPATKCLSQQFHCLQDSCVSCCLGCAAAACRNSAVSCLLEAGGWHKLSRCLQDSFIHYPRHELPPLLFLQANDVKHPAALVCMQHICNHLRKEWLGS